MGGSTWSSALVGVALSAKNLYWSGRGAELRSRFVSQDPMAS